MNIYSNISSHPLHQRDEVDHCRHNTPPIRKIPSAAAASSTPPSHSDDDEDVLINLKN
jgi:hypothetical protein